MRPVNGKHQSMCLSRRSWHWLLHALSIAIDPTMQNMTKNLFYLFLLYFQTKIQSTNLWGKKGILDNEKYNAMGPQKNRSNSNTNMVLIWHNYRKYPQHL